MSNLNRAIADHLLLGLEAQENLGGLIGRVGGWDANMTNSTVTFHRPDRTMTFRAVLLGSRSDADNTWMWGWANPSQRQNRQAWAPAEPLRARAHQLGIPELDQQLFSLDDVFDMGMAAGSGVAMLAAQLLGLPATYFGSTGHGEVYFGLVDLPRPASDPVKLPRFLSTAAELTRTRPGGVVRDRDAIHLYAHARGLMTEPTPTGVRVIWPGGSTADVVFDAYGTYRAVESSLTPGDARTALPYAHELTDDDSDDADHDQPAGSDGPDELTVCARGMVDALLSGFDFTPRTLHLLSGAFGSGTTWSWDGEGEARRVLVDAPSLPRYLIALPEDRGRIERLTYIPDSDVWDGDRFDEAMQTLAGVWGDPVEGGHAHALWSISGSRFGIWVDEEDNDLIVRAYAPSRG